MLLIFLSQLDVWEKTPAILDNIDIEVDSLLCDDDITYSTNPTKMIRKTEFFFNKEIFKLLFMVPQTNEIKERVKKLSKRLQKLEVSYHEIFNYNISSFMVYI